MCSSSSSSLPLMPSKVRHHAPWGLDCRPSAAALEQKPYLLLPFEIMVPSCVMRLNPGGPSPLNTLKMPLRSLGNDRNDKTQCNVPCYKNAATLFTC